MRLIPDYYLIIVFIFLLIQNRMFIEYTLNKINKCNYFYN